MRSLGLICLETPRNKKSCGEGGSSGGGCLAAAGYRGNQQNAIAFLEGAGFAAEEADVFFVEINVEELADLALIVADVAPEIGEARGEFVEGFGDGGCATVYFRRAVGEAAEGGGDFDGHWHVLLSLALKRSSVLSFQFSVKNNFE